MELRNVAPGNGDAKISHERVHYKIKLEKNTPSGGRTLVKLVIIQRDQGHSGIYWVQNQGRKREGFMEEVPSKLISVDE